MELRVLKYFVETARQASITKASQMLNVTQPTMSRQIKDLEYELGQTLFERTNYSIKLTPAGELLYKHAEDILAMAERTKQDFLDLKEPEIEGCVAIGAAESKNISFIADSIKQVQAEHPKVRFDFYSGDTERVEERLDKGLFSFGVIVENVNLEKYNCLTLSLYDGWGLIMRADNPLSQKKQIELSDVLALPIICSRQALRVDQPKWFGDRMGDLQVVATTDLSYNGSVLVKQGLGNLLTFDGIIDTSPKSALCFRPLYPPLKNQMHIIWRKFQVFTRAEEIFLKNLKDRLEKIK